MFNVSINPKNDVITSIIPDLLDCWSIDFTDPIPSWLGIMVYRDLTSIMTSIVCYVGYLNVVVVY